MLQSVFCDLILGSLYYTFLKYFPCRVLFFSFTRRLKDLDFENIVLFVLLRLGLWKVRV